jgi:ornithine--oxo-acid transaminase
MNESPANQNYSSSQLLELADRWLAHNYAPLDIVIERGEGSWVWDIEGNKYLDLLSAYGALNLGHLHPRIVECAKSQLQRLTLTSRAFHSKEISLLAMELAKFCELEMVLFMNSGAEAVETAIKAARKWGYEKKGIPVNKAEIIVFSRNFHGRTTTIVGFSDSLSAKEGFGPFIPGFVLCPYDDLECLEAHITPHCVGVLIEPIQGEGGVNVPKEGYLKGVESLCRAHNVLLMIDEVQTGFYRTGVRFAYQREAVDPDLLILGKTLGGGVVPISAVVGKKSVMEVFTPGTHGSTFGGNPFACAIAREVLLILADPIIENRVESLGELFRRTLIEARSLKVRSVRGKGLLIGVEFTKEAGTAKDYAKKLLERKILTKDTRVQTLRFAPPLTITDEDLEWGLQGILKVLG